MEYIQTSIQNLDKIISSFNGVYTNSDDSRSICVDLERAGEGIFEYIPSNLKLETEFVYFYAA